MKCARRAPLRVRHAARVGVCSVVLALQCVGASAQEAASSPMGQGQANINVRSDVTLGIEGSRSTPNVRLQQVAEAATDQLPNLRKCYRELSAKRPTAAGAVAVRVTLDAGNAPPTFEFKPKPGTDADVATCVQRAFTHAAWRKVDRPAAAILTLEFDNSRAKGEQAMVEQRELARRVEVVARPTGGFEASWADPDGKVTFRVGNSAAPDAIEPVLLRLRDSFAAFTDCRRRSEQGGRSPVGTLDAELKLTPKAKPSVKVVSSSVAHPRAIPCTQRALSAQPFEPAPTPQTLDLHVTFGG